MNKSIKSCLLPVVALVFIFSGCKPDKNLPPEPDFSIRPYKGNVETIFTFDASNTTDDHDSLADLRFRWDWQSDGIWDTDWDTDPVRAHRFTKSGTYQVDLQVADVEGLMNLSFQMLEVDEFVLTDPRDEHQYKTVKIGEQLWMSENLQYDPIVGTWCYHDSVENCEKYGRLYSWEVAQTACPPGWKLPEKEDWDLLFSTVGENPGTKLRSLTGWNGGHNGTDTYGMSIKPVSYRHDYGEYTNTVDSYAYFWPADSYSSTQGWAYLFSYNKETVDRSFLNTGNGFSIRCLRD